MCTLALYFRILDAFPLIVAANRDEQYDRPSSAPTLNGTNPAILAGRDLRAGGTWFGVNSSGLIVGILNRRPDGLQPAPAPRSRGLLCLDLLTAPTANDARAMVAMQDWQRYQPFTVVFTDCKEAWIADNRNGNIRTTSLPVGLHVFTNSGESAAKATRVHECFAALIPKLKAAEDQVPRMLTDLQRMLSDHTTEEGAGDPKAAVCAHSEHSGTVSSSIVFYSERESLYRTFYCPGSPCRNTYLPCPSLTIQS